jgi:hypothetical protein
VADERDEIFSREVQVSPTKNKPITFDLPGRLSLPVEMHSFKAKSSVLSSKILMSPKPMEELRKWKQGKPSHFETLGASGRFSLANMRPQQN